MALAWPANGWMFRLSHSRKKKRGYNFAFQRDTNELLAINCCKLGAASSCL